MNVGAARRAGEASIELMVPIVVLSWCLGRFGCVTWCFQFSVLWSFLRLAWCVASTGAFAVVVALRVIAGLDLSSAGVEVVSLVERMLLVTCG